MTIASRRLSGGGVFDDVELLACSVARHSQMLYPQFGANFPPRGLRLRSECSSERSVFYYYYCMYYRSIFVGLG